MLAPGSDRIPVELLQILTQYAICRLPAPTRTEEPVSLNLEPSQGPSPTPHMGQNPQVRGIIILQLWKLTPNTVKYTK